VLETGGGVGAADVVGGDVGEPGLVLDCCCCESDVGVAGGGRCFVPALCDAATLLGRCTVNQGYPRPWRDPGVLPEPGQHRVEALISCIVPSVKDMGGKDK
jgi:hypothetical protein